MIKKPPVIIDVRDLPPPEPMTEILRALSVLPADSHLQVIHHREPFPLYQRLHQLGFEHLTIPQANDLFYIHIYRTAEAKLFKTWNEEN